MTTAWILTFGDYVDPTQILGVYTDPGIARAWFTHHAMLKINDPQQLASITEGPDQSLRVEVAYGDFLALTPQTPPATKPQDANAAVRYRGEQHEVTWLGLSRAGVPTVMIRSLSDAVEQTVPVADLDDPNDEY